mmetsp:Transcript_22327/g.61921  ORF Transcript_22327/g.61921 Transcript_22327/m.61921 type:complete len:129 (+) Transcript_22327:251-637(+)|eukprot:CAMPEP_0117667784 /NCGR_PEP_ID=MMETSP0804-20121206/11167_1 /TAXON_ID=1074897 /ORGANISM="Tetraselmis astigmatica, Strain CCMP880" /LENGTH=128 /DNA_ID=CAMNT_0005475565 /DNA_START=213 /DNA_END=599 /DNA_ORIENTATION=-
MASNTDQAAGGAANGAQDMMSHLEGVLQQLESAQGGEDPEARALMEQLRAQLGGAAGGAQPQAGQASSEPGFNEVELAQHLDSLEEQLNSVQETLRSLPKDAKEMLGESASIWMKSSDQQPGSQGKPQ